VPAHARTFWGERMAVTLPEEVSIALRRTGFVEYELSAFLLRTLAPGATFVDVGAHVGYFTLLASRCVGAAGQVLAFEPTASTARVLARNTRGRGNVRVVEAAVWSAAGELVLNDHGVAYSAYNSAFQSRLPAAVRARTAITTRRVPAVLLDDYSAATGVRPDVVKVDAESAELHVLRGMRRLLAEQRPVVTLEVGDLGVPGAPLSRDLVQAMADQGYQACELVDGRPVPHRVRRSYDYDNLVFLPRDDGGAGDV
jgi:FkbM family methyltransferase